LAGLSSLLVAAVLCTPPAISERVAEKVHKGRTLFLEGDTVQARYHLGQARDIHFEQTKARLSIADYFIARALAREGQCEAALREFRRIPEDAVPEGDLRTARTRDETGCVLRHADVLAQAGRCPEARAQLDSAPGALDAVQTQWKGNIIARCTPAGSRTWPWVTLIGGVALIGTSAGLTALAVSADNDEAQLRRRATATDNRDEAASLNAQADDKATTQGVATGTAIAAGVLGVGALSYAIYRFAVSPTATVISLGVRGEGAWGVVSGSF